MLPITLLPSSDTSHSCHVTSPSSSPAHFLYDEGYETLLTRRALFCVGTFYHRLPPSTYAMKSTAHWPKIVDWIHVWRFKESIIPLDIVLTKTFQMMIKSPLDLLVTNCIQSRGPYHKWGEYDQKRSWTNQPRWHISDPSGILWTGFEMRKAAQSDWVATAFLEQHSNPNLSSRAFLCLCFYAHSQTLHKDLKRLWWRWKCLTCPQSWFNILPRIQVDLN